MAVISFSREASKDEMGREIDRRGAVIDALTEERDRLAKRIDELQELFRIDGEDHASVVRYITNRHETRITKYAERIKELRDENAELLRIGSGLANAAFNLSQDSRLTTREGYSLRKAAGEWDDFRALLIKHKATSKELDGNSLMTLRCTLEIVSYGMEEHKTEIFRADISNTGTVRHEGFGHEICRYKYTIYKQIPPALQKNGETLEKYSEGFVEEHDRRDGPWRLVQKVVEEFET